MTFDELRIDRRALKALRAQRITEPTPVQAKAVPPALEGRDVTAIAQTGTGKTLAFGLPALTRLAEGKGANRMLVLAPTRELAQQVHAVLDDLGGRMGLRAACIYGGAGMEPQTRALRRGCDIVVATPGRLIDHLNRGNVRFDRLEVLVLDEADRMLDMGFMPDIRRIVGGLPKDRQTLLFSATFPKEIERFAAELQQQPVRIEVGAIARPVDAVRQRLYTVLQSGKLDLLCDLLGRPEARSTLVFLRTKHRTDRIAKQLSKAGFKARAIHGGRTQRQREQAIDGFRDGRYNVLVATDVAARGLDVQGITHVVNFDLPNTSDDYIHRIGRTGRASAEGDAITFATPEDAQGLRDIEKALGGGIPREDWGGSVPVRSAEPTAVPRRNDRGAGGSGSAGAGNRRRRSGFRGRRANRRAAASSG
jgi:ATP-dependent RNA helicase RhlE